MTFFPVPRGMSGRRILFWTCAAVLLNVMGFLGAIAVIAFAIKWVIS